MRGVFFLGAKSTPVFEMRNMKFDDMGQNDVLVEVHSCGICGTDVHIYHGEEGSTKVTPPIVLGHEFAGIVTDTGDSVSGISIGDHVTIDPNMYCGKCMPCRMGRKQNCENLKALGVNCNGGFAQYAVCPAKQCFVVDKSLDYDVAAMTEPLACVVHGIDNTHIVPGQTVTVIGGGTIGLLMVEMARITGAATVILSEPVKARRNIGLEVGADAVIDPINECVSDRIKEITGRDGTDIVIECVGKPFATEQAFQVAGFGATILLFSVPQVSATAPLPLFDVYKKELRIVGSMINPDTHQRAVNLLNSGRIEVKKLITHHYDIEHLEDAIKMQMSNESIKVIVHPQDCKRKNMRHSV